MGGSQRELSSAFSSGNGKDTARPGGDHPPAELFLVCGRYHQRQLGGGKRHAQRPGFLRLVYPTKGTQSLVGHLPDAPPLN
jgi:hypothetical protein